MNFESRGNPRVTKKCEYCDKSFRTRNQDKKYCSDECYTTAKNNRAYLRKLDTGGMNQKLEETNV